MAYNPALFEQQRRGLMDNYSSTGAMQAYANFISNQRGARGLQDLREGFQKQQQPLVASFGRRGLQGPNVRSGAFRKAMADFGKNQTRETADFQRSLDEQNQQFGFGNRQREAQYQSDLANIESDKASQIEQDALALMRMRAEV
jgi:hypothetical protein